MPRLLTCVAAAVLALQVSVAATAHTQLPAMGDGGQMTVPAERQLGDRIARQLYRDPAYIDDPLLQEYVQNILQRLLDAARTRGELTQELDERFAWRVVLIRQREINAFALPGGYLGINLGLLAAIGNEDELATVLAHELSHVTQRHYARMMDRQSKLSPMMLAGMVLGMLAAGSGSRSGGDLGQAVLMGTQAYGAKSQLGFSRDMEREADRVGFGVMTQAGFAPQGAVSMFEKLQDASRLADNGLYPYLRSHPLTSERIADLQGRFDFSAGTSKTTPPSLYAAMMSARARALSSASVEQTKLLVDSAGGPQFDRAAPTQQAATLYAAALSAKQLRQFDRARAIAARLLDRVRSDVASTRLARMLMAEIELAAATAQRASPWIDVKSKDRPEQFLAAQWAVATGQREAVVAPIVQGLRVRVARDRHDAGAWRMLASLYKVQNEPLRAVRAEAEADVAAMDYVAARSRLKTAQNMMRATTESEALPVDHHEASIIDSRVREIDALLAPQANAAPPKRGRIR